MNGAPSSQFVQFPFGGGMNQDVDPRLLQQPAVTEALNIRIPKAGVYEKRPGMQPYRTTELPPSWAPFDATATQVGAMASLDGRLLFADDHGVWMDMPGRASRAWRGLTPPGMPRKQTIWSEIGFVEVPMGAGSLPHSSFAQVDCAAGTTAGNVACVAFAWVRDTRVYFMVMDAATLTPIQLQTAAYTEDPLHSISNAWAPRVMWLGTSVYLIVAIAGNLSLRKLDTTTWQWSTIGTVVADCRMDGSGVRAWYDVSALTGTTTFALAYQSNALAVKVLRVDASTAATLDTCTSAEAVAFVNAIGVHATPGESVWVTYIMDATFVNRVTCLNEATWTERASFPRSGPATLGGYNLCTGVVRVDSTTALAVWCGIDTGITGDPCMIEAATVTTAAVLSSWTATATSAMLAGRPFVVGSGSAARWLIPAVTGANGQPLKSPYDNTGALWSARLLEVVHAPPEDGNTFASQTQWGMAPVATTIPYLASGYAMQQVVGLDNPYTPCSVVSSDGKYIHAWSEVTAQSAGSARESLCLISYDPAQSVHLKGRQIGPTAFLAGLAVDQTAVMEHGWLERPEAIVAVESSAGTGHFANGSSFNHVAVWAYATRSGQIIRSAPSNLGSNTAVAAGPSNITVKVPLPSSTQGFLPHIWDGSRPYVELYRATAAAPDGPFYLCARAEFIQPTDTTPYVSVEHNIVDADLVKLPQLYTGTTSTTQAVVSNAGAPTFVATAVHKSRLFGVWPDRRTISFTSLLVPYEIPHCHNEFTLSVDDDIVALVSMDETLIAFSDRAIYALDGDGPSDRYPGGDSDYRGFRRICSDVGCSDPLSPCLTADGVVFRSRNGLNVLTRGGQVAPWGREVQDELDAYTLHTVITLHPNQRWLYVTCDNGANGVRLVYDYVTKAWTKDRLTLDDSTAITVGQHAHDGAMYLVDTNTGDWWKERNEPDDEALHLDDGAWVTMSATLAQFQSAGALGFQGAGTFHFMGVRETPHGLTFRADYDHQTASPTTYSKTDSQITAYATAPLELIRWAPPVKESAAIRITVTDTAPTVGDFDSGKGATWVSWGVDYEPKKQPRPVPKEQKG